MNVVKKAILPVIIVIYSISKSYAASPQKNETSESWYRDDSVSMLKEIPGMMDQKYDALYPYYMKFCATTKYHPYKDKGVEGSIAGHGLYYFKGLCADHSVSPAKLKLCSGDSDFSSSETGIGLSVNKGLKNVNFIMIPGLRLFLAANIFEQESFDFDIKTRIIDEILQLKIFQGIEFHDEMIPATTRPEDREEFIARYTFGSDYAISMARNLYCINIPMNQSVMGYMANFLNQINTSHLQSKGSPYRGIFGQGVKKDNYFYWNGVYDNCVHPGLNALASLGVIRSKSVNKPLISQIFNVAIPANTILDIFKGINDTDIDPEILYDNPRTRETFLKHKWIPQHHGALVEAIKLARPNGIFKEDDSMFILPHLFKNRKKYLNDLSWDPRYSVHNEGFQSFAPNLALYKKRYKAGLIRIEQLKLKKRYLRHKSNFKLSEFKDLEHKITHFKSQLMFETSASKRKKISKDLLKVNEIWADRMSSRDFIDFVTKLENYLFQKVEEINQLNKFIASYPDNVR